MPPSKFEANPMLRLRVKRAFFSLFTLASSCSNVYFHAYTIIDFLADRLVFLNTVTYNSKIQKLSCLTVKWLLLVATKVSSFCSLSFLWCKLEKNFIIFYELVENLENAINEVPLVTTLS